MDYEEFKKEFHIRSNIDLNFYKEKQMKRRIETLIGRWGFTGYDDFMECLNKDKVKCRAFIDYITINVTEFFRTGKDWSFFENEIIPDLILKCNGKINVWSAGCATGEEAYSLAMSFARYIPTYDINILATDIDDNVLQVAHRGFYSAKAIENMSKELLGQYFVKVKDTYFPKPVIRSCIEFKKLDLFKQDYPQNMDVIVCRNVMIYFTDEGKRLIFDGFYKSLNKGGCLFLGNSEQIISYKKEGYLKRHSSIYIKM